MLNCQVCVCVYVQGMDPPITQLHANRMQTEALPPLMPKALVKESIPTFDPEKCNASLKGLFNPAAADSSKSPPIRVERIATCMGCVLTTCVADVDQVRFFAFTHHTCTLCVL